MIEHGGESRLIEGTVLQSVARSSQARNWHQTLEQLLIPNKLASHGEQLSTIKISTSALFCHEAC